MFFAFTTANDPGPLPEPPAIQMAAIASDYMDAFFLATVDAVDEPILNAMLATGPMTDRRGRRGAAREPNTLVDLIRSLSRR